MPRSTALPALRMMRLIGGLKSMHRYAALLLALIFTACQAQGTRMNTTPSPTLEKLFAQTKPVCFGRFILDVPAEAQVVWGGVEFDSVVTTYLNQGNNQRKIALAKRDTVMKDLKRHPEVTTFETSQIGKKSLTTLIYWESDNAKIVGLEKIFGYLHSNEHLFVINTQTSDSDSPNSLRDNYFSVARALRARAPEEIPSEPGVCIEGGFIADASGQYQEIFAIGFRFPSLPDVSFSISSNKDQQRDAPFSARRAEAKKFAEETGQGEAFARVKVLREGKRQLAPWQIEEALFARPRKDGGTNHEFLLESPGIRYNKDLPFWDAVLRTGVQQNIPTANASSLSNAEAVALWDRLLGTLRLRVAP
jgi:hypothetical protein